MTVCEAVTVRGGAARDSHTTLNTLLSAPLYGTAWYMALHGMALHSMALDGMALNGLALHGMALHGMALCMV